jgi:hypothetical protein
MMLSDEDIISLPSSDPTASDFGLSAKDAATIKALNLPVVGHGSLLAQVSAHSLAWGAWLWLCIYYWDLSVPMIVAAFVLGMVAPMAVALGLISIFNRIHLRLISQNKIQAYEDWRQAVYNNENQYKNAYKVMELEVVSRSLKQWESADYITQCFSDLFHEPEINEAQFIGAHRLPCKLDDMERFFKFEIFRNQWTGANPAYTENVKTNLVSNLVRFIEIDEDTFTDPVTKLSQNFHKAEKLGVPIDAEKMARQISDAGKSADHERATNFMNDELAKSKEYLSWIKSIEVLVGKTKSYNNRFFW